MSLDADVPTDTQATLVRNLNRHLTTMINARLCPDTVSDAIEAQRALSRKEWQQVSNYVCYASIVLPEWEFGDDRDQLRFAHGTMLAEMHESFKEQFGVE